MITPTGVSQWVEFSRTFSAHITLEMGTKECSSTGCLDVNNQIKLSHNANKLSQKVSADAIEFEIRR
jgi:hypothetical protein